MYGRERGIVPVHASQGERGREERGRSNLKCRLIMEWSLRMVRFALEGCKR